MGNTKKSEVEIRRLRSVMGNKKKSEVEIRRLRSVMGIKKKSTEGNKKTKISNGK